MDSAVGWVFIYLFFPNKALAGVAWPGGRDVCGREQPGGRGARNACPALEGLGCTKISAAFVPLGSKSPEAGIEPHGQGVGTGISVLSPAGEDGWAAVQWKPPAGSGIPSFRVWIFLAFNPVLVLVNTAPAYPTHRAFICVSDKRDTPSSAPLTSPTPLSSERLLQMCSLGPGSNLGRHVLKHSENSTAS